MKSLLLISLSLNIASAAISAPSLGTIKNEGELLPFMKGEGRSKALMRKAGTTVPLLNKHEIFHSNIELSLTVTAPTKDSELAPVGAIKNNKLAPVISKESAVVVEDVNESVAAYDDSITRVWVYEGREIKDLEKYEGKTLIAFSGEVAEKVYKRQAADIQTNNGPREVQCSRGHKAYVSGERILDYMCAVLVGRVGQAFHIGIDMTFNAIMKAYKGALPTVVGSGVKQSSWESNETSMGKSGQVIRFDGEVATGLIEKRLRLKRSNSMDVHNAQQSGREVFCQLATEKSPERPDFCFIEYSVKGNILPTNSDS